MLNAIDARRLAYRSLMIFGVIAKLSVTCASAQMIDTLSTDSLGQGQTPVPAAYHVRTNRLLVVMGSDVRAVEQSGVPRLVKERVYRSTDSRILRIRIDVRRDRLWILDVGAVHVLDLANNRRIRSVTLPNWSYADDETNCLPDLQLDPNGAAFVSSNVQPALWWIDPDSFSVVERSVSLDSHRMLDVGFSALAITDRGVMFAAMAAPGLLWRVDTDLSRAENVRLASRVHGACALEAPDARSARDFTLFVLAPTRGSFELRRVDVVAGAASAYVSNPTRSPASVPATLLAHGGGVYLALSSASAPTASWQLRPINARSATRGVQRRD